MKAKNMMPTLLYPARLSFKIEGHRKSFSDKVRLKEYITTKPAWQEMLNDLLKVEEEIREREKRNISTI